MPVIVSEWGTSDSKGGSNGVNYFPESDVWVDWMNQRNLTWINWNFSNKAESSAALIPSANLGGPCISGTPITVDFVYNGVGEYCWEATSLGTYINS